MFKLKKGHQLGVYVPLRALFLVIIVLVMCELSMFQHIHQKQIAF